MSPKPYISLFPLLILPLLIPNSYSSAEGSHGYLEIRLKSPFVLNATVTVTEDIYFPTNKRVYNVLLHPDRPEILTNIPVTFHRPGTVLVNSGPVDLFGLHYATIRSDRWNTEYMFIRPEKINLPFSGFQIWVKCDRNWHGPYCDKYCNDDHAKLINRRCTHHGTLGCPYGFRGPNCDIPIDWVQCPCGYRGLCISEFQSPLDTVDRLICQCPLHDEGDNCEKRAYDYADAIQIEMHGTITVTEDIYFPTNKRVYNVLLHPDRPEILTNIPVTFHRPGTVLINSGPVDLFGLHYATIRSDRWNTKGMTIAPDEINLPFSGLHIWVRCDRHWTGPYCDKYCNYEHAERIGRICTRNGTLACPYDFRGPNCDIPLDWWKCPCEHHGQCVAEFQTPMDTVDRQICQCGGGYEGDLCEKIEYNYADAVVIEMHGTSEKFELLKKSLNGTTVRNELRYLSYPKRPGHPFDSFYEH
ncbi:hypothetical protein B9Z55_015830 [Caenorhabditis nigoni]|uniref:Delta-like protein n=1 Tax=Caenorhabditis nigoni TaxID=1611254 RepID=A0A2G5UBY6_9PELO|nr:hypothetical protein B9Z55_015830 [Caenorhabditis nigoni]